MSGEKLKPEKYHGLAGMNPKFSPYVTGPLEFLDIQNMDFQMPGALTQRWGSTMYVGQTLPGKVTSLVEFTRLSGASYVVFGSTGAMYFGATTGLSQGMSFMNQGAISVAGAAGLHFDNVGWNGSINVGSVNVNYYGDGSQQFSAGTTVTVLGQTLSGNVTSFATINNYLFAANGSQFYKFDGASTSFVTSPPVFPLGIGKQPSVNNNAGASIVGVGATGSYLFYGSFVNSRGFEGQIWPMSSVNASTANSASLGGTFIVDIEQIVLVPPQYDIASINIYTYWSGATLLTVSDSATWLSRPYVFQRNVPISGLTTFNSATVMAIPMGSTLAGLTYLIGNVGALPDPAINSLRPLGLSLSVGAFNIVNNVVIAPYNPQYLEVYQNRLFLAGFSSTPSTSWFSEVGEPEGYQVENNFEVRTNDGDVITGMRSYGTRLYYFKRNSFHVLSGDSPQNFFLQEVSLQYGALNNRCIISFGEDEQLGFLDAKGIIVFNGAKPTHASLKVQPIFDRMNYTAALTEACMVHDKLRNQVLCAIPVDGSSVNNITVVYDYAANAWTTQTGVAPAILAKIRGRNNTQNAFYGSYSGMIMWYGASFASDSGAGFTCYVKSRFDHEMGDTTQKQYRYFYMNMDPPAATLSMPLNFYQDYGTSKVLQSTFVIGAFQGIVQYGISARSLAFEIYHLAQSSPLRIYGYSLTERMQRNK